MLGSDTAVSNLSREEFERDFKLQETNWFYKGMSDLWTSFLGSVPGSSVLQERALDIGCGVGGKACRLKSLAKEVFVMDLSSSALKFCSKNAGLSGTRASMEHLPYKNGVFSFVNAFDVLEHASDDAAVLREMHRVMSDGGRVSIAVPAFNMLWSQHDIANFHKRRYTIKDLRCKMEAAGFEVKRATYVNFFLFPFILAIRFFQYRITRSFVKVERTRVENIPEVLNNILYSILKAESLLIKKIDLPFGVGILCVARKK